MHRRSRRQRRSLLPGSGQGVILSLAVPTCRRSLALGQNAMFTEQGEGRTATGGGSDQVNREGRVARHRTRIVESWLVVV